MTRATIMLGFSLAIGTSGHAQEDPAQSAGEAAEPVAEQRDVEMSGEWRSLEVGQVIYLEKSGKSLIGKRDNGRGYAMTYALTQQADGTYTGVAAEEFSCRRDHFCRTETPMKIGAISADRIEGRIFGADPPKGFLRGMRYCDSCGKSEENNATWRDFVWVRDVQDAR